MEDYNFIIIQAGYCSKDKLDLLRVCFSILDGCIFFIHFLLCNMTLNNQSVSSVLHSFVGVICFKHEN